MDSGQYAVVISCSDTHPREIVKLIVKEDEFTNSTTLHSNITAYPWHIDTKYYTTDVHICALEDNKCDSDEFTSSVEAVILQFDSNKNDGLDTAASWFSYIEELNPEIRILVCDRCLEDPPSGTKRLAAQEWCIARGFELVELNPELDEEWEQEQDFIETTGAARITQALHAHMWPNLSLKDQSRGAHPGLQSLLVNGANGSPPVDNSSNGHVPNGHGENGHVPNGHGENGHVPNGHGENGHVPNGHGENGHVPNGHVSNGHGPNGHINELAENIHNINLADDEVGYDILQEGQDEGSLNDDYFELFQNLAEMKERVANMPTEERRACAERVVRAFWTAMGGDSAELSDLDDNSD